MNIYHVVLPADWKKFEDAETYEAESLQNENFIHCSFEHQLAGVVERYYSKETEVIVLEIDTNLLTSEVINEPSTNDELFPHIYGSINQNAIISTTKRTLNSDVS